MRGAAGRGRGGSGDTPVLFWAGVLLAGCLLSLPQSEGASGSQKLVQISVSAPWGAAPLALEASEFFAGDDADLFWSYAEALPAGALEGSDKQQHEALVAAAGQVTTGAQVSLLNFALALRNGSPKLEVHRSMWDVVKQAGCGIASPDGAVALVGAQCLRVAAAVREAVQRCTKEGMDAHTIHPIDHVHPSSPEAGSGVPTVILYATLGTEAFAAWHAELAKLAGEGAARYVLRHTWTNWRKEKTADCAEESLPLQGYGAELAVKNMEYKAVDDTKVDAEGQALDASEIETDQVGGFDFKVLLERRPELAEELKMFRDTLSAELSQDDDIKVWKLKDLGIQACQHIMQAREPLRLMRDLSHNLPSIVMSLSRLRVNPSVRSEIEANHQFMTPGMNLVLLNGREIDVDDTSPFGLLSVLRYEIDAMEKLTSLGIDVASARKLLLAPSAEARGQGQEQFKIDINKPEHVFWLNDLESDARYRNWPRGLEALLTRGWPGQLKYVARNIYTAIYIVDPGSNEGLETIMQAAMYVQNQLPVRFGFIFESPETRAAYAGGVAGGEVDVEKMGEGEKVGRLFSALYVRHGREAAFAFATKYAEAGGVDEEARKEAFKAAAKAHCATKADENGKLVKARYSRALNSTDGAEPLVKSTEYVRSTGLSAAERPVLVVNGLLLDSAGEEDLMYSLQTQLQTLQRMAYYGQLQDSKPIYPQLVPSSEASKRYHKLIVPGPSTSTQFVSIGALKRADPAGLAWAHCAGDKEEMKAISHLVAVDLADEVGRGLLVGALEHVYDVKAKFCNQARLAFVDSGAGGDASAALAAVQRAVGAYVHTKKSAEKAEAAVLEPARRVVALVRDGKWADAAGDEKLAPLLSGGGGMSVEAQRDIAKGMGLGVGESGVATGGRVFRASADVPFLAGDFSLAEATEFKGKLKSLSKVVGKASFPSVPGENVTPDFLSDVVLAGAAVVAAQAKENIRRQEIPPMWKGQMTGFSVGPEDGMIQITAFLDPLCKATQRMAPLLMTIADGFGARVQVFLNPQAALTDVPIKGYFRYVLKPKLEFDESGALKAGHRAVFNNLPASKLLTMNLHAPDAWFVEAQRCAYDMDNILLDNLPEHESILSASYSLEHLLLTGHAIDERMQPPAGLQLALAHTGGGSIISDTIVMSNLGYFQLKARPGVWALQSALGRSKELYELEVPGGRGWGDSVPVTLSSFEPEVLSLSARKRSGKEHLSLLAGEDGAEGGAAAALETGSLWDSFTGMFGSHEAAATPAAVQAGGGGGLETIHVFSLASGHLYERFLKIMMLSVVRNTKHPVKFWLLRNFLSPQFKESIGGYARKHGFEYELVTYKWPSWLHGQTEKQRIIWGYKILMLDVLFPLSVPKIIYIDSDQVVRADLSELWKMDLKGRSLAYTPFCDSNKEMEGYRFWKQGFWAQHLGRNKYHISALYVVDLNRFRASGSGDQLRVLYSQLSRDPNSLANLDQDLPNYAQHIVPIFSLPQEWLWCETWCSNDTKPKAKTIDLCNNPMTKEPKLDQAKRIIAEWVDLDEAARSAVSGVE